MKSNIGIVGIGTPDIAFVCSIKEPNLEIIIPENKENNMNIMDIKTAPPIEELSLEYKVNKSMIDLPETKFVFKERGVIPPNFYTKRKRKR